MGLTLFRTFFSVWFSKRWYVNAQGSLLALHSVFQSFPFAAFGTVATFCQKLWQKKHKSAWPVTVSQMADYFIMHISGLNTLMLKKRNWNSRTNCTTALSSLMFSTPRLPRLMKGLVPPHKAATSSNQAALSETVPETTIISITQCSLDSNLVHVAHLKTTLSIQP